MDKQKDFEKEEHSLDQISLQFKEYFNRLDNVLSDANDHQQHALKKKYRYFLTKLMKLQQIQRTLKEKLSNLDEVVENSNPIKQEKNSIEFINMISGETMKKLGVLGQKVNSAKQIKQKNQKDIENLKEIIKKEKSQFFSQKKEEIKLSGEYNTIKKKTELIEARKKFKKIIENKNSFENSKAKFLKNVKSLNFQQLRMSEKSMMKRNDKIHAKTVDFQGTSPVNKLRPTLILTDADHIDLLKTQLLKQNSKMITNQTHFSSSKPKILSYWDSKWKSTQMRWWLSNTAQKNPASTNNQKRLFITKQSTGQISRPFNSGDNNILKSVDTNLHSQFSKKVKKDCKGCKKRQYQDQTKNIDKFILEPEIVKKILSKNNFNKLNINNQENLKVDENLQRKFNDQEKIKQDFMNLMPQQILYQVNRKGKLYELSKLIQASVMQKYRKKKNGMNWKLTLS